MNKVTAIKQRVDDHAPALRSDRIVGLTLARKRPEFVRKDTQVALEDVDDEQRQMFRVSKRILDAPEFLAIVHHDDKTYLTVLSMALPKWFRKGEYLLPVAMLDRAESYLTQRLAERNALIAVFRAAYPERKLESRERLSCAKHKGNDVADAARLACDECHYDPEEYPSIDALCARFALEWEYTGFAVAGALENFRKDLWQREQTKLQERGDKAVDAITVALRAAVKGVLDHWVDVLRGEGGKPKVFKAESLDKLRQFLDDVRLKNVVDDVELDKQVTKVLGVLGAVDAKELRNDAAFRDVVVRGFMAAQAEVDKLAIAKPARRIRF
jgi:hypothetical protein